MTYFLNQTNRFFNRCSGLLSVNNKPQFLHLNLCLLLSFPQRITSRFLQPQHRFFFGGFSILKKFDETNFIKLSLKPMIIYLQMVLSTIFQYYTFF